MQNRYKTINPYRKAANLLLRRLSWDFKLISWKSRKKLISLQNTYSGQKCVILCNGPSLLKVDFDFLQACQAYTFGLNKINLLFEKTNFRPNAIVAVNPFILNQNLDFYNTTPIPLFVDSCAASIGVRDGDNRYFLHSSSMKGEFAEDCSTSIFQGYTVTYVALQIAFHMGFKEVALIGADHYFQTKGVANETITSGDSDPNHFDPNYFAGGVKWQLPDLAQSELAYMLARQTYEYHGRRVVNCTIGGQLDIFPREKLTNFL